MTFLSQVDVDVFRAVAADAALISGRIQKARLGTNIGIENCDTIGNVTVLKIKMPEGWRLDASQSIPRVIPPGEREYFILLRECDLGEEFHEVPIVFITDHPKNSQLMAKVGYVPAKK